MRAAKLAWRGGQMGAVRKALLGKVHLGKKQLGWSDEVYRDVLGRLFGRASAAALDNGELARLVDEMRRQGGFRDAPRKGPRAGAPALNDPQALKARHLWRAAWNLGAVDDGSEAALDRFVAGEHGPGVQFLRWCTPPQLNHALEAVKDICERAGYRVPSTTDGGLKARRALVRAQWARLGALGALRIVSEDALHVWVSRAVAACQTHVDLLGVEQLDMAIGELGAWVRRAKGGSAHGI